MEAATIAGGGRSTLGRSPLARLPDRLLKYGLTALAGLILALIVYFFFRLVGEAKPAFEKEGVLGFAFDNNWNVERRTVRRLAARRRDAHHLGARAADRRAGGGRDRDLRNRALPAAHARAAHRARRPARRGALGRLRAVGDLLPRAQAAARRAMGGGHVLVHAVHRRRHGDDPQLLRHGPRARDHDPADRRRDQPRGDEHRPLGSQGSGARARRDALGDDPHRRPALLPPGHRRRRDARPRARDRRDDRRDDPDRRRPPARAPPVRPGLQPRRRDRQRVRRGRRACTARRCSRRGSCCSCSRSSSTRSRACSCCARRAERR